MIFSASERNDTDTSGRFLRNALIDGDRFGEIAVSEAAFGLSVLLEAEKKAGGVRNGG